ncbi:MAG: glycosyltransferase [Treponema sp.]|jgi:glycosyltransferase involved in cell wall biosynthesis/GT2 family glycosyltransferase|nr:glycosyltransferase [Treponema sp.]
MNKTVSIVICTYNRAHQLNRTLNSLKNLAYKNFEVVVVNGPSTDNTRDVLARYEGKIKTGANSQTNLSISRNIGIELSAGEIIAFIDDDAIPDKYWLDDILSLFEDGVGGVGGKVFGPDGNVQFNRGYVDIWGWGNAFSENASVDYNNPTGRLFNYIMGTNSCFLKKIILEVGGFDEYIDYYLDESDLCVRIIKAGYKIMYHPRAYVYHEFAKSHIRKDTYDPYHYNWRPIIKNSVWFAWKNSGGGRAEPAEREENIFKIKEAYLTRFERWFNNNCLTKDEYDEYVKTCHLAFARGYEDCKKQDRQLRYSFTNRNDFFPFDPSLKEPVLTICMVCKDNILKPVGGTAKHTHELAVGYVKAGHVVHVVTQGNENMNWSQDGIFFHAVGNNITLPILIEEDFPAAYTCLNYSYNVYKIISHLNLINYFDVVESALWDWEAGVASHLLKDIVPILIRLQTPLLKNIEAQGWTFNEDYKLYAEFEREMIDNAFGIISISDGIKHTIEDLYDIDLSAKLCKKIYLGVKEVPAAALKKNDGYTRLLFVGRLERRKGVHTIFEVLPRILMENKNVIMEFIGNTGIRDAMLNDTFEAYFRNKYENEPWYNRARFLGEASDEVKIMKYKECDIFIAPSLYESFGIILVEAMSAGKPVICAGAGGMKEIVVDGETGYAIEPENSGQLYEKIKLLIDNKELREELGQKGYARYKKYFTNEIMTKNSLDFYKEAIKRFKSGENSYTNRQPVLYEEKEAKNGK